MVVEQTHFNICYCSVIEYCLYHPDSRGRCQAERTSGVNWTLTLGDTADMKRCPRDAEGQYRVCVLGGGGV